MTGKAIRELGKEERSGAAMAMGSSNSGEVRTAAKG